MCPTVSERAAALADDFAVANAASVRPAETVDPLEAHGARLEALLRALRDEELNRTAPFGPAGGQAFSTADLAPAATRHTREHLGHAKSAVGEPA